mgnify:FL=1
MIRKIKILLLCRKNEKYSMKLIKLIRKQNVQLKIFYSETYKEKLPKKFINYDYEYILSFRSYLILKKNILKKSKKAFNFHPSTPNYRGVGCVNYALLENKKNFGITIHEIDEAVDFGKILHVATFKIEKKMNLDSLLNKTHKILYLEAKKFITKLLKNPLTISKIYKNKGNYTWSKKYNNVKALDKLYVIKKNIDKKQIHKLIKATNHKIFKPYIKIHGEKFVYEKN